MHRTNTQRRFAPISLPQAVLAENLDALADTWSRAPDMGEQLVQAVVQDLDVTLLAVPALAAALRGLVDHLRLQEWNRDIDSSKSWLYKGSEHLTHIASRILLDRFVCNTFQAMEQHLRPTGFDDQSCQWLPEHQL